MNKNKINKTKLAFSVRFPIEMKKALTSLGNPLVFQANKTKKK